MTYEIFQNSDFSNEINNISNEISEIYGVIEDIVDKQSQQIMLLEDFMKQTRLLMGAIIQKETPEVIADIIIPSFSES